MAHHFVDQQCVEVGVGDDHRFPAGRPQGWCCRHLGGVGAQLLAELDEFGQDDSAVVVALGQDLPATLVAGEVVMLEITVLSGADCDGETFGLGETLVDVRSLGA